MDALNEWSIENTEVTSKSGDRSMDTIRTSSHDVRQSSGFLRLPRELRDEIYSLLLVREPVNVQYLQFEADSWTRSIWEDREQLTSLGDMEDIFPKRKTGILSVSKQISQEALYVLYGCNLFILHIHGGAHENLLRFGYANIRRIRVLRIIARPMGICYPNALEIDSRLWDPLLKDLNLLCLVAQQPLRAAGYYNAPSLEEDMQKWVAWLEPILGYLAGNIARTTIVEMDDDGMVETDQLMQKWFPAGYENVQTVIGDKIFMRGEFSWESGYWDEDSGMNFADGGMGDDWSE